jgi:hypothetical protein
MQKVDEGLAKKGLILDRNAAALTVQHSGLDPYLRDILVDIISLCSLFNDNLPKTTLDVNLFLENQTSICYRLLQFHPLASHWPEPCDAIQVAYHTGLTVFMMTMFLQHDRRRVLDYTLISRCVWQVLDSGKIEEIGEEFALWFMIMGGIWISVGVEVEALLSRIRSTAEALGIARWEDARLCVAKFPWIHALHDQPGHHLWNRVFHEGAVDET